jgi:hypothetical protein
MTNTRIQPLSTTYLRPAPQVELTSEMFATLIDWFLIDCSTAPPASRLVLFVSLDQRQVLARAVFGKCKHFKSQIDNILLFFDLERSLEGSYAPLTPNL